MVFSEPVSDFTAADVTLGGTATHGVASVTGSGTTYTVTVPVTPAGTVTAASAAGVAHDAVGNAEHGVDLDRQHGDLHDRSPLTVTVNQAAASGRPDEHEPGELHRGVQLGGDATSRRVT